MSVWSLDKATLVNIVSTVIVLAYVGFMLVYPDKTVPAGLVALANIAIGYIFTTAGITLALKYQKPAQ